MTKHHRDLEEAERSGNNEKLYQILTACLNVKEGEKVWIHGWDHTIDLASEIAFACKQKGAQPFVTIRTEDCWIRSLRKISKDLLETLPTIETAALGQTEARAGGLDNS